MKKLVIIPGGFHPFHVGHKAMYDNAVKKFPGADVYVAATADTSTRPFPFELKKKLAVLAGIPAHRFMQVKSPFRALEITKHYDPEDTILIFARSEKDVDSQPKPGGVKKNGDLSYLQPASSNMEPMSKHGYMAYLPTVQFGPGITSASEIRAKWPDSTHEERVALVSTLYPATVNNEKMQDLVIRMFNEVMGNTIKEAITSFNNDDPMDPEVLVPGYGYMTLKLLEASVARDLANTARQAGQKRWNNVKHQIFGTALQVKLDAIETAYKELEEIRKKGGPRSIGIEKP